MKLQLNPPSNTLVRRAVIDEAPIIARVLYQAFVEFEAQYTPAAFAATTPASDQIQKRWSDGPVWVAVQGDQLVGTISAIPKSEGLYVRSMAVLPSTVVMGLGSSCFRQLSNSPLHRAFNACFSAQPLFWQQPFDYMTSLDSNEAMRSHMNCSELHSSL